MTSDEQAAGYARCVDAMIEAAEVWRKQHPFAEPRFHNFADEVAREAGHPGKNVAIVALLSDVMPRWAANEDARSFLRAMDAASEGEATYLQAKAILDRAVENALERAQGQFPAGSWACVGCGKVLDGFTSMDGKSKTPGPGSLSVCGYCGELSQVNAAGDGYETLSVQEFNAMPKSVRVQLRELQKRIRDSAKREQVRS